MASRSLARFLRRDGPLALALHQPLRGGGAIVMFTCLVVVNGYEA
jgi:hypothetical protein